MILSGKGLEASAISARVLRAGAMGAIAAALILAVLAPRARAQQPDLGLNARRRVGFHPVAERGHDPRPLPGATLDLVAASEMSTAPAESDGTPPLEPRDVDLLEEFQQLLDRLF